MSSQMETDSKPRDIPYLDSYAMERWECVLHYMVGSQQQEGISADAVRILLHAGLMKRSVKFQITYLGRECKFKCMSEGAVYFCNHRTLWECVCGFMESVSLV
jgi:hypothetical protein